MDGLMSLSRNEVIRSSAQSSPRRMKFLLGLGVATTLSVALVKSAATGARWSISTGPAPEEVYWFRRMPLRPSYFTEFVAIFGSVRTFFTDVICATIRRCGLVESILVWHEAQNCENRSSPL